MTDLLGKAVPEAIWRDVGNNIMGNPVTESAVLPTDRSPSTAPRKSSLAPASKR